MSKKIFIAIMIACFSLSVQAQIAKWLVRPDYDFIEMTDNGLFKVSTNGKVGLLDKKGKKILFPDYDSISSFKEDRALLYKSGELYGFTDKRGKVTPLNGYKTCFGVNRFYAGTLLVMKGNEYFFLGKDGKELYGPFAEAYPFYDGHACVKCYADDKKDVTETYYDFIRPDGERFELLGNDKKDVRFMSSFHRGSAVVVIKKKFYTIDAENYNLTPISIDNTLNKKSLVVSPSKDVNIVKVKNDYVVSAKNGRFIFDKCMRLKAKELVGHDSECYSFPAEEERTYTSRLDTIKKNDHLGLTFNKKDILPPQFSDVFHMEDNFAIVKLDGKCGVVIVDTKNNFLFKLNNNENIGFNHQYYDAKLASIMPPYIKCSSVTVTSHSDDCEIQIESRTENENVEGNTLGYNCRLSIPANLTDTLTKHDYFYSLKYEGLVSIPHKVSISEWYVKNYEVKLSNTNFTLSSVKDTVSVEFDLIKTDLSRDSETNYFKNIEVVASNFSEQPILNKITENHYIFQLFGIDQELINFSIRITEVGCPTIEYPFEMMFVKPKPREKRKKTTVTITPIQKKSTPAEKEIILLDD